MQPEKRLRPMPLLEPFHPAPQAAALRHYITSTQGNFDLNLDLDLNGGLSQTVCLIGLYLAFASQQSRNKRNNVCYCCVAVHHLNPR
jgi:hypothetical protein